MFFEDNKILEYNKRSVVFDLYDKCLKAKELTDGNAANVAMRDSLNALADAIKAELGTAAIEAIAALGLPATKPEAEALTKAVILDTIYGV